MVTVIRLILGFIYCTNPPSNLKGILILHTCNPVILLYIHSVPATKPVDLQGETHDLHKSIKTEARHEHSGDIHSSHKMNTSVIRIPHEYG